MLEHLAERQQRQHVARLVAAPGQRIDQGLIVLPLVEAGDDGRVLAGQRRLAVFLFVLAVTVPVATVGAVHDSVVIAVALVIVTIALVGRRRPHHPRRRLATRRRWRRARL